MAQPYAEFEIYRDTSNVLYVDESMAYYTTTVGCGEHETANLTSKVVTAINLTGKVTAAISLKSVIEID
ncbi:MAG: hypothetical protein U9O94_03265 [Nanoarchaeota archaeon]|nr:hypothetical protein [Nanoarchaeota archaeon]